MLNGVTYVDSVVHYNDGSRQVIQWSALACDVFHSLNKSKWRCRYLWRRTIFKSLVLPVLLCGCSILTLSNEKRNDAFGIKCLCSVIGYRWSDLKQRVYTKLNQGLLPAYSTNVNGIYEHVTSLPMWGRLPSFVVTSHPELLIREPNLHCHKVAKWSIEVRKKNTRENL